MRPERKRLLRNVELTDYTAGPRRSEMQLAAPPGRLRVEENHIEESSLFKKGAFFLYPSQSPKMYNSDVYRCRSVTRQEEEEEEEELSIGWSTA